VEHNTSSCALLIVIVAFYGPLAASGDEQLWRFGDLLSVGVTGGLAYVYSMDGACSGRLVAEQDFSVCLCIGPRLAYFLKVETMIE
jgi:hypothetical protein